MPLSDELIKHLRSVEGDVIEIMDISNKTLNYLYQEHVIEAQKTIRSKKLIDIIMRGSDRAFQCFCDCLSSDGNQEYLVPSLQTGIQNIVSNYF